MPFHSELLIALVDDLSNDGQGAWEIRAPLEFTGKDGIKHVVPIGFLTDLNSTPRIPIAFLLAGNTAHRPSALHDYLLTQGDREYADNIFREAMESIGMPQSRVRRMYNAVRARTEQVMNPWGRDE